jgi:hypothetical protein
MPEDKNELVVKIINLLVGLTHKEAEDILQQVRDKLYNEQVIKN